MSTVLARRIERLESETVARLDRRWHAAVSRLRDTMDPTQAREVAQWLRENVDGKSHGPHVEALNHVCPRCIDRLKPPALARAVWLMLLDHTLTSGAPVAMPPDVAAVYLQDPDAYPANPCDGCGYLMPTRSTIQPDGSYHHIASYAGDCPVCGLDSRIGQEVSA